MRIRYGTYSSLYLILFYKIYFFKKNRGYPWHFKMLNNIMVHKEAYNNILKQA
ncbi:hypothetical protein CBE01nite_19390 [Clostridium beijerinckii]|nr:hypothetical protein CBE01nite_19390 [Clostridium beijerinckii]